MTWKQARIVAAQHAARINLPRRLEGMRVVLREHFDLEAERLVAQAFAREVRKRGGEVVDR